ncbi:hypothetical protein H0W26_00590, partial [Candidatus Dependentiae bacterium]|nr:hypothetical protein [Candidatus Dependentiae bacterium]
MNYTRILALLIIAGTMATGTYSWGMEAERVASVMPNHLPSNEDTQVILDELWKLPPKLKNKIILLSLDDSLSCNFICSRILEGPIQYSNSVALSSDGTTALTGLKDSTARLVDVATGKQLYILPGHTGEVTSVALSPDGKT